MTTTRSGRSLDHVPSQQVPPAGSITVDHVAHFVPETEAASAALVKLGFTLTPFSAQSHRLTPDGPLVSAGTGNRCVMLERGYLEFLTPTGDTPIAGQLRAALARYVGVHLIAFGTNAPDADHARLVQHGFEPLPPVALQRPIATETGEDTARFTVVRVPPGKMIEGRIQFCQHHTPHLVWQQRWLAHRNAVTALGDVLICVSDPAEAAARYSRYTGLPASGEKGVWRIATARGAATFTDPRTLEGTFGATPPALPWIAGYALESGDLSKTHQYFAAAGCELRELDGGRLAAKLPPALGGIAILQPAGSRSGGNIADNS